MFYISTFLALITVLYLSHRSFQSYLIQIIGHCPILSYSNHRALPNPILFKSSGVAQCYLIQTIGHCPMLSYSNHRALPNAILFKPSGVAQCYLIQTIGRCPMLSYSNHRALPNAILFKPFRLFYINGLLIFIVFVHFDIHTFYTFSIIQYFLLILRQNFNL
jgi:hypothetical protein